jgi:ribosomal RNA-processing protein 1
MSDKPLVQQALATDLALLLLACRSKKGTGRVARFRSSLCYLKGFWQTIVREWTGLDRHR